MYVCYTDRQTHRHTARASQSAEAVSNWACADMPTWRFQQKYFNFFYNSIVIRVGWYPVIRYWVFNIGSSMPK